MVIFDPMHALRRSRLLAGAIFIASTAAGVDAAAAPGAPEPPAAQPAKPSAEEPKSPGEGEAPVDDSIMERADPPTPGARPDTPVDGAGKNASSSEPPGAKKTENRQKKRKKKKLVAVSAPHLYHSPVAVAEDEEPLRIDADLTHPSRVKRALLVFRPAGEKKFRAVEFRRGEPGPYVAVISAQHVQAPHLDYTVELELHDGSHYSVFGTRAAPHRVQIPEEHMDVIEANVAQRVDDRRAVFWSGGEYVSFGSSKAQAPDESAAGGLREDTVPDWYFRVEGGFTYRLLRTVSEFGIRIGVLRGSAPVPLRPLVPGQEEEDRFDVGLNYGAPWVRFRLADNWHLDGSFLVNVTEVGFSAGTGGKLHIGDPYGSKLTLGFEAIQTFGASFFTELDIQAHERVRVSPIIEVTNAPSAEDFGMRLLAEVGVDIGWGFAAAARGGYQARLSTSGGPTAGGAVSYAF